ncbi:MAG: erythromycin esterase family protein, partial [Calditrichota bacterium]
MKTYFPAIKLLLAFLSLSIFLACVPEKSAPTVPTPVPPVTENQVDSLITVWLKDNVIPLSGVEPQPSNGDLQAFNNVVGNSSYILLGESVDGSYEIAALKQRLSRFLIEEKGFQILLMEIPWSKALELNEFLINGTGDLSSALGNSDVWWLSTTDMRSFFSSLRAYNQTVPAEDQVRVYGMDMLSSGGSITALTSYLQSVDAGLEAIVQSNTGCITPYLNDPNGYFQLSQSLRDACVASLQAIVDTLSADLARLGSLS